MNSARAILSQQPRSLRLLVYAIILTLLCGFTLSAIIVTKTINSEDMASQPVCLSSKCVDDFLKNVEGAVAIAKGTIDLVVAIATTGGIFVALLSYINTASNAALTNHIEHLKVFSEYLNSEITKRERLKSSQIDSLLLYGKIFHQSRNGKTTVSDDYRTFLEQLNTLIDESNQRCVVGTPGGFSYGEHQRKIRDHLSTAGIAVYTAPRNDYFEMEGQVFSLLNRISQSFCSPDVLPSIQQRSYI